MKPNTEWIDQAEAALKRSAIRAREIAAQTNTSIHVIKDGKIVRLTPTAKKR